MDNPTEIVTTTSNGATSGLFVVIGIFIAFLIGLFSSRKTSREDAKVIDLTGKIRDNQKLSAQAQKTADDAVKEYQDELKKYDPNFHSDDDGSGKPSA